MVERCKELGAPFMAGSSVPGCWRAPFLEHPAGSDLEEACAVMNGGSDIYGAHALETLQAFVERRGPTASESGVAAVQCLQGDDVWAAGRGGLFSLELALAACSAVQGGDVPTPLADLLGFDFQRQPSPGETSSEVEPATAWLIEYRDGFRATLLILNGFISGNGYAARVRGPDGEALIEACKSSMYGGLAKDPGGPGLYSGKYPGTAQGTFAHFACEWPLPPSLSQPNACPLPHITVPFPVLFPVLFAARMASPCVCVG
jgi:hypothetical protein